MIKCEVCGQDYGLAHNCPRVAPAQMTQEEAAPPPVGFALLYYLRLAFNIARWDDISIRRASRDPNAVFYGALFWAISAVVILMVTAIPQVLRNNRVSGPAMIVGLAMVLNVGLLVMAIITFVQLGLCHLIAKWFFGGTGTLMGVMRPLLLGWFVNVLGLIPVQFVALWAAGIAWTAVLMLVFEEIDGISRLQAFFISAGINFCFVAFQFVTRMHHS